MGEPGEPGEPLSANQRTGFCCQDNSCLTTCENDESHNQSEDKDSEWTQSTPSPPSFILYVGHPQGVEPNTKDYRNEMRRRRDEELTLSSSTHRSDPALLPDLLPVSGWDVHFHHVHFAADA